MPVKLEDGLCGDRVYWAEELDFDLDINNIQLLDMPDQEFSFESHYLKSPNDLSFLSSPLSSATISTSPPTTNTLNSQPITQQIRNHDCMWSGRCAQHQEKSKCSYKSLNLNSKNNIINKCNNNTVSCNGSMKITTNTTSHHQQIPAGHSLLISKYNQKPVYTGCGSNMSLTVTTAQQQQINTLSCQKTIPKLPTISTSDFLKVRDNQSMFTTRPDTPTSLDDDMPEFKHSLDLSACTMGSNQMSLVSHGDVSSAHMITLIKDHLEDTSDDSNSPHKKTNLKFLECSKHESLDDLLQDLKEIPDYPKEEMDDVEEEEEEEEEDDEESNDESDSESGFSSSGSISNTSPSSDGGGQLITPPASKFDYPATHVDDHCYTRSKNRVDTDPLGVQTPSDSEEEIDVVSVGDKTLPTNPSARDRRALQTTVADRISARMVKTPRGIKTLPPRRQYSYDDSLVSSCSSTPTKSSNSQHNFSLQCGDVTTSSSSTSGSRKRQHTSKDLNGSGNKRHRGKKQRSPGKRQNSDTDEADTIEKRNLHNDMERQRRIGLKNLFEELKRQIPSIRDKERAPKVSILREAASLCTKLNREQEQLNALKKQQHRLMQRVKSLRTSLANQWG